ncbi:MAG: hypothetical protein K2Z80_05265 [Xanthobacteraceae bacterium]|nr:hypothetical protein [Xanthobacteraceae bacterium]
MRYGKQTLRASAMIALAIPNVLAACATNENQGARSMFEPQAAALERYDRSSANYRQCVLTNEANPNRCEWQRNLMEADHRQLHASLQQK